MRTAPLRAAEESVVEVRGPWFEELHVGQVFDTAPAVTLTDGQAAVHQAVLGDRLRLPLSEPLATEVIGRGRIAAPGLVWDVAIGQSTVVTQRVRANLFYRGLVLRRSPVIGDTLSTRTEIVALKQNRARPDRPATGLAALRITTVDQADRPVLDFWRCAMIPLADPAAVTGHDDDLAAVGRAVTDEDLRSAVAGWSLPAAVGPVVRAGQRYRVDGRDVVSSAPELARLSLNVAAVHHDAHRAGGRRLVYGGHTIGVALGQATRALPGLLTVVGWHSCDHLAPVHEGDLLASALDVERVDELPSGGRLLHLRSQVTAEPADGGPAVPVLDWRFVAVAG
ncbi:MaoC family dehydratase [uncultured Modestobacter sp.]|uniref:MaoC family dehydratase n=1 Tax=uncultured Modestobacter sp. TaxID=380048 RepID=UPI002620D5F1|nr:MaoC family dehydratase [uncultured Modestobacter sp.]